MFDMLNASQVAHIAKLARLGLKDGEEDKFAHQLSDILGYMEMLNEVDTANVEPTSQVTGLTNVLREDKEERFCQKEELLNCTPLPLEKEQIRVKPVITQ
jgi:aspartyl-tRNA(Asn)/glutamyl-tRNA(Gln) amidotransferase subunit C